MRSCVLNKECITKHSKSRRQKRKSSARSRRSPGSENALFKDSKSVVSPLVPRPFIGSKEVKIHVFNLPATITTSAWVIDTMAGIAQGLNWVDNRLGNRVLATHLCMDTVLTGGQTNVLSDDNRNTIRLVIVEAVAKWTFPGLTLNSILDPRAFEGLHRVIHDEVFTMESPGRDTIGYLPAMLHIRRKIRLNQQVCFYGSGNNTSSDRSVIIGMVSDSAVAPSPGFVSGAACIHYMDD